MQTLKSIIFGLLLVTFIGLNAQEKFSLICQPYLQNLTDSTVTVVMATNRPSVAWVEIAPDDASHFYARERPKYFDSLFGHKNTGTIHRVTVRPTQNTDIVYMHVKYSTMAKEKCATEMLWLR